MSGPEGSDPAVVVARLQGQVAALQEQIAGLEAADEHHRSELAAAWAEVAESTATMRAALVRMEAMREATIGLRRQVDVAEAAQRRAEQERAAVIAGMGWRARRQLGRP